MTTWIIIAVGAFIALLFAAEIHFGKLTKVQTLRGGKVVMITLLLITGSLFMLGCALPWLERKAAAHGVISRWWVYLALATAFMLITQVAKHRKRQRPQ